jgi:hypothetical protein
MSKVIWSQGPHSAEESRDEVDDIEWPCRNCGETGRACECESGDSCEDCGEFWQWCECERDL